MSRFMIAGAVCKNLVRDSTKSFVFGFFRKTFLRKLKFTRFCYVSSSSQIMANGSGNI